MEKIMELASGVKAAFTSSGLEVPRYEKQEETCQDYEERNYSESVWVSAEEKAMLYKDATTKGFWKLFNYIQGENEEKKKIPMTAPVTVKVVPGAGPNCESTFTVSFYVGAEYAENPPKPTNPDVFIQRWGPKSMFVRQFSGFASEEDWLSNARTLGEKLPQDTTFIKEYFYTAGYDAPFKLFNRRNEIWFIKE